LTAPLAQATGARIAEAADWDKICQTTVVILHLETRNPRPAVEPVLESVSRPKWGNDEYSEAV
jgi:hypothetical protein